ncbi:MAG: FAD:protein FMN transferase, partial [Bacteriovoracia bacterium]
QASDGAFRMMAEREYELAGEGARSRRPPGATAFRRVRRTSELGFDLGGLAKGYIVDAAFARLVEARPDVHWVVNAGGDLRSSHPFRAAVRVPTGAEEFEYDFMLPACALATSSRETSLNRKPTARYLPRRDPSRPSYTSRAIFADTSAASRWDPAPVGPNTVCVMAENCLTADALTKVGLFRGTGDVPGFPVFQMAAFASNGAVIGDGRANGA